MVNLDFSECKTKEDVDKVFKNKKEELESLTRFYKDSLDDKEDNIS